MFRETCKNLQKSAKTPFYDFYIRVNLHVIDIQTATKGRYITSPLETIPEFVLLPAQAVFFCLLSLGFESFLSLLFLPSSTAELFEAVT